MINQWFFVIVILYFCDIYDASIRHYKFAEPISLDIAVLNFFSTLSLYNSLSFPQICLQFTINQSMFHHITIPILPYNSLSFFNIII